jgi:hypothetical protein
VVAFPNFFPSSPLLGLTAGEKAYIKRGRRWGLFAQMTIFRPDLVSVVWQRVGNCRTAVLLVSLFFALLAFLCC